jgi:hypothetical protein
LCSPSLAWSSCSVLRSVGPAATMRSAAIPRSARSMVLPNIRRMLPRRRRWDPEQRLPTRHLAQHRRHAPLPWPGMKSGTLRSGYPPTASSSRVPRLCATVTASQKCGTSEVRGITFSPSSVEFPIEEARDGLRCGLFEDFCDDGAMPLICPTCQTLTRRKQGTDNAAKQLRQVETAVGYHRNEKPAAGRPARATMFAMMSMCP